MINLNFFPSPHRKEIQATYNLIPASIHEFRIPSEALLGLHSYCPVHFDTFHAALVDLSVHVVYLKSGTSTPEKLLKYVTLSVLTFLYFYFLKHTVIFYVSIDLNCSCQNFSNGRKYC